MYMARIYHVGMHHYNRHKEKPGSMVLSMDGLFGLPQKMTVGINFRDAIQGRLSFRQQEKVDEHIAIAGQKHRKEPKICIVMHKQAIMGVQNL